jgi:hypothetical protein
VQRGSCRRGRKCRESRCSISRFAQKLASYTLIAAETRGEKRNLLAVIRQSSCVSSSEAKQIAGTKPPRLRLIVKWFVKGVQYGIPISSGIRRCRTKYSSWNRNVCPVASRFLRSQWKNWSSRKNYTGCNAGPSNPVALKGQAGERLC